ncbi:MAG: phosphomannomutase/phosphoglucomutase, partial [Kiritimatiellae bacterium]|nr:phosphomannomutase/phosphoglucomutase [Kiritimatiellia bacterium]
ADARAAGDALGRYLAWLRDRAPGRGGLRYAVDCSNGMASLLVRELFPDAAAVVNDTPDGRFPAHSPNPLKAEAREQIAALVRENGLDAGVVFDGDADRCMFVDENGDFVSPDCLVPVVAASLGAGVGDRVLHDVRTSRGAIEAIRRLGAEPVMSPVGHAFAKPLLRSSGAVCGGELAGHYYFREFHCCDSGALAALKILGEVAKAKREGMSFSGIMRPISGVYANSGELNFRVEDKDAAIGRVLAAAANRLPAEVSRSDMDGLRLEFAEGWVNVRRSNTEPYLRLVVECDTPSRLEEWKGILSEAISAG